ncbi:MAG TPA: hypothetical protein PK609_01980 [Candidatus Paceibacterota bacterium]|nr:hypothetical protein [Candidatus Paceibacterota bacterium]
MVEITEITQAFRESARNIASVVQFGSSLHSEAHGDIDLCVVIRSGEFYEFVNAIQSISLPEQWDISLLRNEELGVAPFRYGSHGQHLLLSIKQGRLVYGEDLFSRLPDPDEESVRFSILERLYDYLYEVRKLAVSGDNMVPASLKKRWGKFQRLALYLLTDNHSFPGVLSLAETEMISALAKIGIDYRSSFSIEGFELIWEKIQKRSSSL